MNQEVRQEVIKQAIQFHTQLKGVPYKFSPNVRRYLLSLQENMTPFEKVIFLGAVNAKSKWPRVWETHRGPKASRKR